MNYFTNEDRQQILNFIIKHKAHNVLRGNVIWQQMEASGVCPLHTWQSMREHFRKRLVHDLDRFKISQEEREHIYYGFLQAARSKNEKKKFKKFSIQVHCDKFSDSDEDEQDNAKAMPKRPLKAAGPSSASLSFAGPSTVRPSTVEPHLDNDVIVVSDSNEEEQPTETPAVLGHEAASAVEQMDVSSESLEEDECPSTTDAVKSPGIHYFSDCIHLTSKDLRRKALISIADKQDAAKVEVLMRKYGLARENVGFVDDNVYSMYSKYVDMQDRVSQDLNSGVCDMDAMYDFAQQMLPVIVEKLKAWLQQQEQPQEQPH